MSAALKLLRDLLGNTNSRLQSRNLEPDLRKLDNEIEKLKRYSSSGSSGRLRSDFVEEAVQRYYNEGRLASFRDAYLVSHGVLVIPENRHLALIEDLAQFPALLEGVDQYVSEPRRFRRCYQGLLRGYFGYDPEDKNRPPSGPQNWSRLRRYLDQRAGRVLGDQNNPRWAECLQEHRNLFTSDPCGRYGEDLLAGKSGVVDELRKEIGITDGTWFMRKLYLAQVRAILGKPDPQYLERLPRLVELITGNMLITDEGLALTLDRHAALSTPPISAPLRELAVQRWGSPWLPGNAMPWSRVQTKTRDIIADWLKLEFIREFFMLLAEDGQGDNRRLYFWQRYSSAIERIYFALGSNARKNSSQDYLAMRKRLDGLIIPLQNHDRSMNAFVMRIGPLVLVEFSVYSNACYGYEVSQALPFSLDGAEVTVKKSEPNSLKSDSRDLWLPHNDGIKGYATWEERFEAELAQYGIYPRSSSQAHSHSHLDSASVRHGKTRSENSGKASTATSLQARQEPDVAYDLFFSLQKLADFAQEKGLAIDDLRRKGGALWVRCDDSKSDINRTLQDWRFQYKHGKGWWLNI